MSSIGVEHETGFPSDPHQIGTLLSPAVHLPEHPFRHGHLAGPASGSQRLCLCASQLLHLLAMLLGLMEPLTPLIPLSRLHKQALQRDFQARWSQTLDKHALQRDFQARWSQTHLSWDVLISLGPWFLQAVALLVQSAYHHLDRQAYSRQAEHSSRVSQQDIHDPSHTMDPGISNPSPILGCLVWSSSESVCDKVQPQTSTFVSPVSDVTASAVDALSIPFWPMPCLYCPSWQDAQQSQRGVSHTHPDCPEVTS